MVNNFILSLDYETHNYYSTQLNLIPQWCDMIALFIYSLYWVLLPGVPPQVNEYRLHGIIHLIVSSDVGYLLTRTKVCSLEIKENNA